LGDWYQWEGEDVKKVCREVNMVEILCIPLCKCKMIPIKTTPEMGGGRGIKDSDGGGEFNYDIFDIL
jgi:hypothetical protein